MKKGVLICFVGIDGSGKTTIAKKMNKKLKNSYVDSIYTYGRVVPVISRFFMWLGRIFILRKDKNEIFNDYDNYSTKKKSILKKGFISEAYKWILLFDHIVQINYKIRIPLLLGKIVVSDRYIFDTVITDISPNLGYSSSKSAKLILKLFRLIPEPEIVFFIDVPVDVAYKRKNDVPHINYLIDRKILYDDLMNYFKVLTLDGSQSIEEITQNAYNIIIPVIRRKNIE